MEILGPAPARYDTAAVPLSPQRARVLEQLQRSAAPFTVESLASRLGLHPNTARKHLEALVERGLATRSPAPIVGRGRPGWEYTAALGQPEPDHRVRDYAGLAGALAAHISRTSTDPEADALAAGDTWGRSLVTELGGDPQRAHLRPFAEPGACLLHLNDPIAGAPARHA